MEFLHDERLPYRVGGLLYFPATKKDIAEKLADHSIRNLSSIAFCLEDAIQESARSLAEATLKESLAALRERGGRDLPLIFVRICTPEHLSHVHTLLGEDEALLTGYILPKFDESNAEAYAAFFKKVNEGRENPLYFMPILESLSIADIGRRKESLASLKKVLDRVKRYVLNVRVGGNDFCNLFGLRRGVTENVYQIGVVRDILTDILSVFSREYVVSGPVWEYFDDGKTTAWREGLVRELALDRLNGFIGKTAIHPSQLPLIWDSLRVSRSDYEDAKRILSWDESEALGVQKSADGGRMNEKKTHGNWATRILTLAEIYGVKDGKDQDLV